jgi:hypothetical protein
MQLYRDEQAVGILGTFPTTTQSAPDPSLWGTGDIDHDRSFFLLISP